MERLRKFAKGFKRSKPKAENEDFNPSKPKEESANFNPLKPKEENADSNFVTDFKEEKFSFTWRIENMHRCTLKNREYLESPTFSTRFCGEAKWSLRIYPSSQKFPYCCDLSTFINPQKCEKVGLFINKISIIPINSTVRYRLSCERLLGNDRKEIHAYPNEGVAEIETIATRTDDLYGTNELYLYGTNELYLYGTNELYCPHNVSCHETLVIKCDIYVINIFNMGAPSNYAADLSKSCTLFQDLKEMYESGKFSDITLQAKDMKFPAHKNILASRSKVFDAMFQHDMKETQTGVVQVEDIEPTVLSTLLHYIYTGIVDDFNTEKAISLYSVADKYFLGELKKWCVNIMLENMTVENACQIAVLAELHPDPKLKEATLNLFRNYTSDIFKRKEWQDLVGDTQNHALVSEILRTVSTDFITNCEPN